jgi:hypothetical protein
MSLQHLTLGERMVLAARLMTVEHIRQEADAAGVDLTTLASQPKIEVERVATQPTTADESPREPWPTPTVPPRPRLAARRAGSGNGAATITVSTRGPSRPVEARRADAFRQDLFRQPANVFCDTWPAIVDDENLDEREAA